VFYKKILEKFDLISLFLGFLEKFDVFCKRFFENI